MTDKTLDSAVASDPLLPRILNEIMQAQQGTSKRQELIQEFERQSKDADGKTHRLLVYIARMSHPRNANSINPDDIAPIGSILQGLAGAQVIDLIIHSPGGDGNTAEKIVDMCRSHLPTDGRFRVIVPNKAKSAATLIALGADEIVMGYSSELGPIDAQVPVSASGIVQFISAQSFIDARDELLAKTHRAIRDKEEYQGFLQLLTTIDVAFVRECERAMNFARDVAAKWLNSYMLKDRVGDDGQRNDMATRIASKLSSAQTYLSHGRMISARDIRADPDLRNLQVAYVEKDNPLWKLLWEIYVRSEVFLSLNPSPQQMKAKLFESANSSLVGSG
jgi:hypothetical protein